MIQLRNNLMDGREWDGTYVWVNPDHISFIWPGKGDPDVFATHSIITTVGGGRVIVHETPEEILKMFTNWTRVPN